MYIKAVLTIIAVALTVIAIRDGVSSVRAWQADQCGSGYNNPCYMKIVP